MHFWLLFLPAIAYNAPAPNSSPCNRICRYKRDFYDGQVCIGCYREVFEIKFWASFNEIEKKDALRDADERRDEWLRREE